LIHHRTALKNRIHATLMSFGYSVPVTDLFGTSGRELLARLELPEAWATSLTTSLAMVDELNERIDLFERELKRLGAYHPYIPLLMTVPGIGWVTAYTSASEIGDIRRFASPKKLTGYTGLCPIVRQSGNHDYRDPSASTGPATCAGRSSRPPPTPPEISAIAIAMSGPSAVSDPSVVPRSPASMSPASWPRPSGTS
jgi:transposase